MFSVALIRIQLLITDFSNYIQVNNQNSCHQKETYTLTHDSVPPYENNCYKCHEEWQDHKAIREIVVVP